MKEILLSYLKAKRKLKRTKDKLEEYVDGLYSISSGRGDGMPRACTGKDLSDRIARKEELESMYKEQEKSCSSILERISQMIEELYDENEKDILVKRYIKGYSMKRIADEIGYSITSVQRMHRKALEELTTLTANDTKWNDLVFVADTKRVV